MRVAVAHSRDRARPRRSASTARRSRSLARQRRLVHQQPFGDDLADRHARRQRAERILEDQLQLAPQRPHCPAVGLGDVAALEADRRLRSAAAAAARGRASTCPIRIRRRCRWSGPRCSVIEMRSTARRIIGCAGEKAAADVEGHLDIAALEQDRRVWRRRRLAAGRLGGQQHLGVGMLRR